MKVFVAHSFQTTLDSKYYEQIKKVYDLVALNNHELYLGGLLDNLKDTLTKYQDKITCYSVLMYQSEIKNAPKCNYILVDNSFIRTKKLSDADMMILTPGGTGSLSEFYSVLEEYRCQKSLKKIYILNEDDYYDDLINNLKKLIDTGFNSSDTLNYIEVINLEELEKILKEGI